MKYLFIIFIALSFASCRQDLSFFEKNEEVEFSLPLCGKWKITATSANNMQEKMVSADAKYVSFLLERNEIYAIQAILDDSLAIGENQDFYYEAGCIYPFQSKITFLHGFSSNVLKTFLEHSLIDGNSKGNLSLYAKKFNWKKFVDELEKKSCNVAKTSTNPDGFYNPWFLDKEKILSEISNRETSFSTTYFTLSSTKAFAIPIEELQKKLAEKVQFLCEKCGFSSENLIFVSPYILENENIKTSNTILLPPAKPYKILCSCKCQLQYLLNVTAMKKASGKYEVEIIWKKLSG